MCLQIKIISDNPVYCTPEQPGISISFLFAFSCSRAGEISKEWFLGYHYWWATMLQTWLWSTPVLAGSRHDPYQRTSAFTWADNLVIMFMQFYTEFHKVAMGCRPILDLHKHLYKHRKTANVGLLSLTGQQK